MKIRSSVLDKCIGIVGACTVRGWMDTVRFKVRCPMPQLDPAHPLHCGRYIYAFWHESILAMVGVRRVRNMAVLISRHQDGEYITQIVRRLGARVVRGSSTRGGQAALLGMLEAAEANHLLITPDGPRGPRREFRSGAIFLAARSGLPIVPVGFGFTHAWRAASWDRFALPVPYSLVAVVVGLPITIPAVLTGQELERWRGHVQSVLRGCTESAESWAIALSQPIRRRWAA